MECFQTSVALRVALKDGDYRRCSCGQSFKQYSQVLDLEDKAEWLGQGPGRRKIGG